MVDWSRASDKYVLWYACSMNGTTGHSSLEIGRHISNGGFLFAMFIQLLEYLSYQEIATVH